MKNILISVIIKINHFVQNATIIVILIKMEKCTIQKKEKSVKM